MEEWKDIPWYEWLYQASIIGNIKSLWNWDSRNSKIRILKPIVNDKHWHSRVYLYNKWVRSFIITSRIIAITFLPNPNNYPLVCHRDERIDSNWLLYNWIDNLYWWTHKDNVHDMITKWRRIISKSWKDNNNSKKISQYSMNLEFIKEWYCMKDIERELWISSWNISSCCTWRYKQANGFIWKFSQHETRNKD